VVAVVVAVVVVVTKETPKEETILKGIRRVTVTRIPIRRVTPRKGNLNGRVMVVDEPTTLSPCVALRSTRM
jgi:hypothetical protein